MGRPIMPTRISGLAFSTVPDGVGDREAITAQAAVVLQGVGLRMVAALPEAATAVVVVATAAADMADADWSQPPGQRSNR